MQHHGEADGGGALACKCCEGQGSWLAVDVHGENLPNRKGCLTNIPVSHKALSFHHSFPLLPFCSAEIIQS